MKEKWNHSRNGSCRHLPTTTIDHRPRPSRLWYAWWCWRTRHGLNLADQECLLIAKLFIICTVRQEIRKESQKLITVRNEDLLNCHRLVRVCYEDLCHRIRKGIQTIIGLAEGTTGVLAYLEDVKSLVSNHPSLITQEVHVDF